MKTVVTQFLEQAAKHPKNPAVLDIRGTYTYERMNNRSAYLAEQILEKIGGKGKRGRIALFLPRTKEFVVSLFAVLRAGCAAVPIDGEYPRERVRTILEDVGCALCITTAEKAADAEGTPTLILEEVFPPQAKEPEGDTGLDLSDPEAEGYILYTSGSTGKPKGVVHRQAMLNNAPDVLGSVTTFTENSRSLNIAGFSFIAGTFDTMPLLTSGGSVYIANETERKNMDMIWALFDKCGITGMYIPPQMFTVLRKLHGPLPLEYVAMVGEKFVNKENITDPGVVEFFGASETGTAILIHPVGEGSPLSLGKPAKSVHAYLIDEEGNRIEKPGEIGELCVTTPWLALGYNHLPEETAKRFTENPFLPGERMYHTGDQMAWDEDGSLIFHGRNDRMVKVRGYRIELGEIDQVIRKKEGMDEVANVNVTVHGGDLICCYYTGTETSPAELKAYASTWLPDYMIPEYFIHLDKMPRNDRGKFDYPTLKAMEIKTNEAAYEPPQTELEEKICNAYAETLEMDRVGVTADFFDCGGTSLSAAVLISHLSDGETTLSFQDISAHPTPRELAAFLESARGTEKPKMDREVYPLTKTQMGIYLESLTGGNKATYTLPYMARAAEGVTAEALVDAVKKVMNAHPGMKYIIHAERAGMPNAVPVPDREPDIPVVDGTEEGRLAFMKEYMPIVPMMDSLMICPAVYRTPERCWLAIKTHLIYFDASAISLFISEINRALAGKELIGEDFTVQQAAMYEERLMQDGSHEKAEAYYRQLFKDMDDIPALSGDLNGPLTPGVSENVRYEPGTLTTERVKAFCDKLHISESGFFMGAVALMLGKYLNSKQVSFSTVYNGRPLGEMSRTIGTLIKRIPVYGDLRKDLPVEEYLRGISRQLFNSMANDIYSFDEVLKTCPVNEDVEFIYQGDLFTDKMGRDTDDNLLMGDRRWMEQYHTGMVTGCMSIQFFATEGLYNVTLEYRNEKFTEAWVLGFAEDLFTVAEGLMKAKTIGEVSMLTDDDREALARFNDTRVDFGFTPVHEQIRRRAQQTPDSMAVTAAGETLTFAELDRLSDRIASALRARGVEKDSLVGILFDREVRVYAAEIGVMKAGGAFVPFIPDYPDERIEFCMQDGAIPILLTTDSLKTARASLNKGRFDILTFEELLAENRQEEVWPEAGAGDLAYCIYTSGTTGRPKGVMIEHGNIANYVHRNEKSLEIMHYAAPGRVNLALASFSFDVSVVEEFVPLCNGNPVVIATEEEIHSPELLAKLIREKGVNGMTCTPTYLLNLLDIPETREAIRRMTFFDIGAEAFPAQLYERLRELRDDSVILNVYGPTEATMGCAAEEMTDSRVVTVGPPIANTYFFISDPFGNEMPVGIRGELIICGDQVGRGYINLPDKTAAAFFTHNGMRAYHSGDLAAWTEDGKIRIFGRVDNQIKLRGFRIELDEIEKVMAEYPGVKTGTVCVQKNGGAEYLVGYYTAQTEISGDELKKHMQEKLPEYMVPSVLMALETMPMTSSGKVDKKALPQPDFSALRAEYIAPETETEKALCRAFAKALKVEEDKVGVLDDFFELGGDSLKAMVAMAEAGLESLSAADMFQKRTPRAIAEAVDARIAQGSIEERDEAARKVPHRLSPLQLQMIDTQLYRASSTMWSNMHILSRFDPKEVDAERLCKAVNTALKNHPALSTVFRFDENFELEQQYVPGLLPEVEIQDIHQKSVKRLGQVLVMPFEQILDSSLCRVNVIRSPEDLFLFIDVHHLLMDGGSLGVVMGDIVNAYYGRELKRDCYFALVAEEEKRIADGALEKDRAWFKERYGEDPWCNMIPQTKNEKRNINQAGREHRLSFDAEQVHAAEKHWGVTHSVMAISAALIALSRFTGEQRVMVNWIFNNRLSPEAENAVGMLIKNLPAAADMEEIHSLQQLLDSVRDQVAEGIAHNTYDFMTENYHVYKNDCMEVNLQLGINADELDVLHPQRIELEDAFAAAGARLELELLENEYGDGGFDSEMEYAEGLFEPDQMKAFHELYVDLLERMIRQEDVWKDSSK
ncbi:MAG: amino acid adenylation domain-containing protein [Clostridia bacterium]